MDPATQVKNEEPLISILMLTYNRAHYLSEAITSVLAQTHQNFELIIIDDGSTDNTASVVAGFADERIQYIRHPENKGLHARRHESLTHATGTYTAVLDSDDKWIDSKKLALQVAKMEREEDLVVLGTQTRLIDKNGTVLHDYTYATNDRTIRERILLKNQFTHSAVLMRTSALQLTAGYQPLLAEDLELFLQLGTLGTFGNLDCVYTAHRVHQNSENDHGIKMSSAVHAIIQKHRHHYPHYTKAILKSYLRLIKGTLHLN